MGLQSGHAPLTTSSSFVSSTEPPAITITALRTDASSLQTRVTSLKSPGSVVTASLPPSLLSDLSLGSSQRTSTTVDIVLTRFTSNMYLFSSVDVSTSMLQKVAAFSASAHPSASGSSQLGLRKFEMAFPTTSIASVGVASPLVSLALVDSSGAEIVVANLSTPIVFFLPLHAEAAASRTSSVATGSWCCAPSLFFFQFPQKITCGCLRQVSRACQWCLCSSDCADVGVCAEGSVSVL